MAPDCGLRGSTAPHAFLGAPAVADPDRPSAANMSLSNDPTAAMRDQIGKVVARRARTARMNSLSRAAGEGRGGGLSN